MLSRKKTAKSVRAYQNNAIKKDPTGGHTTIKALLYEEIKKIPEWEGEEKSARKTIREYLYQYILERDIDDSDLEDTINTAGMTIEEQDEELGALIAIDEKELDYISLLKVKVDNPKIVDFISKDFDDIIERLNKLGQKLSIESHMNSYVTGLQRLKFAFKNTVPAVGSRKVHFVENDDRFNQIDDASRDLMENYVKKVPLSFTFPGMVDGKAYIIATVNLPRGTLVHNLPAEFKNFPVLIDYGTMRASTASDEYRKYQNLKPGISAPGDSGAPVFDQDGLLWGIYQYTSESVSSSGVVPIDLILERIYDRENIEFELFTSEENNIYHVKIQ
ncbi:2767_t:CDS:2 [Funneliformis caledonium]|uniref:2767_t:CDS:1 n=1 Tax=Funneliformis caledonium TaxID=1117310 RepID=A0A9N8ZNX8_9GLOM|nr:2767_t:CDS:2 [Funneliformis caledonium]